MAVIQSAWGTRIDCDKCEDYAAAPALSLEVLRRATGYVTHGGRDFCGACWERHTASRFSARSEGPHSGGRPAA